MTVLTATVSLAPSRHRRGGRKPWVFISLAIHAAVLLAAILVIPRFQPQESGTPQGVEMVFEQPHQPPSPPSLPNLPKPGVLPTPTAPPVPNAPPTLAAPAAPAPPPAPRPPQPAPEVNLTTPPLVPEDAVPLPEATPPIPPIPPSPQSQALTRPPTPHRQEAKPHQQPARPHPAEQEASLAHPIAPTLRQHSTNVSAAFFNPFGRPAQEQPPAPSEGEPGSAARAAAGMLAPFAYFPDGDPGPDFRRSLMQWWLAHRFYPPQAAQAGEDGEVHITLLVDRLGRVRDVQLNQGSGSLFLDMAGVSTWRGAQLIPLPDNMGRDNMVVDLTLHYILVRR